jgi:tetratricopeptide (TPR) repeat protein
VQGGPPATNNPLGNNFPEVGRGGAAIVVSVVDESGMPLEEQALVKLYGQETNTNTWGTTQKRAEVEFDSVATGDYQIEASAAGFQTTTQTVNIMTPNGVFNVLVRLKRGSPGDNSNVKPSQLLAPKALKEAEKGLTGLKSGNLNDAQKHLDAAYKLAPTDADINFLLGLLYQQKKDAVQAEAYFVKATSFNPQNVRALTSLGQLLITKDDVNGAEVPLEKAVSVDAAAWQAHWELADVYLHQQKFDEARKEAQLAIQTGKGAANDAELILGETLSHLSKVPEAIQALQTYLQANPSNQSAPAVREMIARLQNPPKPAALTQSTPVALNILSLSASVLAPSEATLSVPTWAPMSVDDEKPVLSASAVCPADLVIDKAGKRVKELVDNLGSFEATEDVLHEDLNELGRPISKETLKFDYMASISEPVTGILKVDEFRNGLTDKGTFPDHIATLGLPTLAFVFHPDMRGSFDLVCEGLGEWQGQATWLVHFRQRSDRPNHMQSFQFSDASFAVDLKGRAWISADTYQIVRLEADLVKPIRQIQLLTEHEAVEYGPVQFKNRNMQLWLPTSADLYMDFRRQRYHRRHSFAHYMLFSVGSSQKISQPKIPDQPN